MECDSIYSNYISSSIKGLSLMTLKKTYQKAVAKDVETEKCTCEIFCFDYKMWKY